MSQNPFAPPPADRVPSPPAPPAGGAPAGGPTGSAPYPAYGPGRPEIGPAFSWAWTMFMRQVGPFLIAGLIYSGIAVAAVLLMYGGMVAGMFAVLGIGSAQHSTAAQGAAGAWLVVLMVLVMTVLLAALLVAGLVFQAGMARSALMVSRGLRIEPATFFRFDRIWTVVGAGLLVMLGTGVGAMFCLLPGLAFAWFAQFTLFFVVDKGLGALDAIQASFRLVRDNLQLTALLYLVQLAIGAVAGSTGVGSLLGLPLSALLTAYVFRTLLREPVAY